MFLFGQFRSFHWHPIFWASFSRVSFFIWCSYFGSQTRWRKWFSLIPTCLAKAGHVGMSENHLRQRVCDPKYEHQMKKETLEKLAQKIGCQWNDLNCPNKNMPTVLWQE